MRTVFKISHNYPAAGFCLSCCHLGSAGHLYSILPLGSACFVNVSYALEGEHPGFFTRIGALSTRGPICHCHIFSQSGLPVIAYSLRVRVGSGFIFTIDFGVYTRGDGVTVNDSASSNPAPYIVPRSDSVKYVSISAALSDKIPFSVEYIPDSGRRTAHAALFLCQGRPFPLILFFLR
ncbi:hypothetical protein BV22DRAFT_655135 [Leucogyrophana mollusca]|uniref:Uncharacterized protein n=1 Tax=Leucogyrophana mollusca TaxID=85980 RepID=A0ACB8BCG2_9AGAM|nr:hypothetical protein BV22DRAFT_655135 [Leucogyrophana mollusca]